MIEIVDHVGGSLVLLLLLARRVAICRTHEIAS